VGDDVSGERTGGAVVAFSHRGLRTRQLLGFFGYPRSLGQGARTIYQQLRFMAASELIDFRRAFLWLLCGMLLPSVALVAFGVVAVANERAAVEHRLENEYQARLGILKEDLEARLQAAATSAGRPVDSDNGSGPDPRPGDPLVVSVTTPEARGDPALAEPERRVAAAPRNHFVFASSDSGGERKVYAVVHTA
jgi:hypothetical protein